MTPSKTRGRLLRHVVVLTAAGLVQYAISSQTVAQQPQRPSAAPPASARPDAKPGTTAQQPAIEIVRDEATLPVPVREMRDAILAAARTGDLKELLIPIQWNELPPDFGPVTGRDPTAYFKKISVDGEGREVLAILRRLLEAPAAVVREGRDIENNKVFVWPYLTRLPAGKLTPQQDVDLLSLIPPADYAETKKRGTYAFWTVVIGADGTWHAFKKLEKHSSIK